MSPKITGSYYPFAKKYPCKIFNKKRGGKMQNINKFFAVLILLLFFISNKSFTQVHYFTNLPLSGNQEVPPVTTSGSGTFTGTYDESTMMLTFTVTFEGLSSGTSAAHFHGPAAPGINGGVQIGWTGFPTGVTSGTHTETVTLNATQEAQLLAGLWYANIHTAMHGGGEIRGQLFETNPVHSFTSLVMNGDQEVPPVTTTGIGIINGTYDESTNTLSFNVEFNGLTSNTTAAHFHGPAPPGINAGVQIGWTGFPTGVTSGSYSNSFVLTQQQEADLLAGLWYANIHTTLHGGGEIRGQMLTSPTIDGNLSDPHYITIAGKMNANSGFGPDIDIKKIGYYADASAGELYLSIEGKLNTGSNDGIGLWLGFNELSGLPPGTSLGGSPGGHYMGGNGGSNPDFKADFEVDYMFAVNPGSGSSNVFLDAVKLGAVRAAQYLGMADQTGTSAVNINNEIFSAGSVSFAFRNDGILSHGFEIRIPFSELGVSSAGDVNAFAFVASSSAFFSDVTVPGNVSGGNPGFDVDFSTLAGGPYSSGSYPLPVELTFFTASVIGSSVTLSWITASELNNLGFEIQRSNNMDNWESIAFVEGSGNSISSSAYEYTDNSPAGGKYFYRLKQIDINGTYEYSSVIEVFISMPESFVLEQNYPNPFNPTTIIRFGFDKNTAAQLKVFDVLGNEVATLFDETVDAGRIYEINFDAAGLSSGIYFYRLIGDNKSEMKKMVLLR
jgi:hypothetical protein